MLSNDMDYLFDSSLQRAFTLSLLGWYHTSFSRSKAEPMDVEEVAFD